MSKAPWPSVMDHVESCPGCTEARCFACYRRRQAAEAAEFQRAHMDALRSGGPLSWPPKQSRRGD